jgi:D-alanyl-D-alanine carboxypeptidase
MSGVRRMGNGETALTVAIPTLRGRRSIAVGFLGALAVTVGCNVPADARHSHAASNRESSGPPYAAIVVDANTGSVLHAANPDEPRHPASLTKIMTLYLLFEQLEAGKLRLDTSLPASEHASEQSPTKLGLRPGQTIEVEDAIRGLVTKSANDAAVVIAEAIGGSERDFAEMMTRKAHVLGMTRTFYHNASGLPDDEQVTTARDQALLGRAIQERFPRYYPYFATPSFTYHGMAMRNHNHLLGQVEGLDGIKTGYTQASGFNLVTSVRRNNRHIVSVVLGGASAGSRDARMRSLIEEYIVAASTQRTVTAVADAAAARDPRPADPRAANQQRAGVRVEPMVAKDVRGERAADARPEVRAADSHADNATSGRAPPTYTVASVASYSRPVPWPAPSAAAPAVDSTPTATVASPSAKPTLATDPIKPIHVKTIKVKLPASQMAALAPPSGAPTVEERSAIAPSAEVRTAPALAPLSPSAPAAVVAEANWESGRDTAREPQGEPPPVAVSGAARPVNPSAAGAGAPHTVPVQGSQSVHSGWIIQVGAFEVEREARQKLSAVQAKAASMLGRADPFTEPVVKGDKTLYRARFAGLQKEEAEAVCRQLKRNDIDCMTVKN